MTYEFNPQSPDLELPNPYRVENIALFTCGGVALAFAGLSLIVMQRNFVQDLAAHRSTAPVFGAMGIALVLWLLALSCLGAAASQLKFYFGRDRPQSLAPTLPMGWPDKHRAQYLGNREADRDADTDSSRDANGLGSNGVQYSGYSAQHYKDCMRQSALGVPEPHGAVNGMLYSFFLSLIFAPALIQLQAQIQVRNFLGVVAVWLSFLMSWAVMTGSPGVAWVGLAYTAMVQLAWGALAVRQTSHVLVHTPNKSLCDALGYLATVSILSLIAFTAFGPSLPACGLDFVNGVVLGGLLLLMASMALHLMAIKHQIAPAPENVGCAQVTHALSMNTHPGKTMEELERILMQQWYAGIPNRRYAYQAPRIASTSGTFSGDLFEEVQPKAKVQAPVKDLRHRIALPHLRWLTYLTVFAAVCMVSSCVSLWLSLLAVLNDNSFASTLAMGALLGLTGYCARWHAHVLWGRFEFVSQLIWVEMSGSFESANVRIGNQITGQVQSAKDVINVEAMTLRVWVCEIESVIFGKDAARQVVRMRPLLQRAKEIADELVQFSQDRSVVVAPTSRLDQERVEKTAAIQRMLLAAAANWSES